MRGRTRRVAGCLFTVLEALEFCMLLLLAALPTGCSVAPEAVAAGPRPTSLKAVLGLLLGTRQPLTSPHRNYVRGCSSCEPVSPDRLISPSAYISL